MAFRVNDTHSALNPTTVSAIESPRTVAELRTIVRQAAVGGGSVAICGSRHAMGGQQFLTGCTLVDTRRLDRLVGLDHERGMVRVEAGIQWPALIDNLLRLQREAFPGREPRWGIAQKQTGADTLTLGGAVSANIHGRGLVMPPLVADIESLEMISPEGELVVCSRDERPELFALAVGGYGLFGAIATVTLRLVPRRKLRRVVRLIDIEDAVPAARRRIDEGCTYGDFQFDIDPASPEFLTKGVFACYQPVDDQTPMPTEQRELRAEDWRELLYLAHVDKRRAFQLYAQHYIATDGQMYWSDGHQLGVYLDGYHDQLDQRMGSGVRCSEMITELYVPPEQLVGFLKAAAQRMNELGAQVIYGTIRLIQKDQVSFLAWARDVSACVIFNLHIEHTPAGHDRAGAAFRALIDLALERAGTFYLTYHRMATREQLLAGYPQLPEFLRRKDQRDPRGVFASDWLAGLRRTLA